MNTTNTCRTVTNLAAAAAVAGALTIMSTVAPTAASAHFPGPVPDPATGCTESACDTGGSRIGSMEIDEIVTMLKVRRAKYLFDHPHLLR